MSTTEIMTLQVLVVLLTRVAVTCKVMAGVRVVAVPVIRPVLSLKLNPAGNVPEIEYD